MPFFSKVSKREEKEKLSGEQIDEIEEKLQETAKKYPEENMSSEFPKEAATLENKGKLSERQADIVNYSEFRFALNSERPEILACII